MPSSAPLCTSSLHPCSHDWALPFAVLSAQIAVVSERLHSALGLSEDDGSSKVSKIQLSALAPKLKQREQQVSVGLQRAQLSCLLGCAREPKALLFTLVLLCRVCTWSQDRVLSARVSPPPVCTKNIQQSHLWPPSSQYSLSGLLSAVTFHQRRLRDSM